MDKIEKLAQSEEVMFERNLAIIASRKQEVQIYSDSFVYEGFICGLDNRWVQLYGHEETNRDNPTIQWRFILIGKDKISAIGSNGRSIHDLDEDIREWINKKIHTFSDVSEKFLTVRGYKNDNRKETR